MVNKEQIQSGIFGFVVGDAYGVPYEFLKRNDERLKKIEDMKAYGTHNQPSGTWSDDSSMTLSTMQSIVDNDGKINYDDIMNKYVDWAVKAKYTATDTLFDIGNSTYKAINKYLSHRYSPTECGGKSVYENGNGSLMRMLPVVFDLYDSDLTDTQKNNIINEYSSLTHANEISQMGCHIYYDFVSNIMDGLSKNEAYEKVKQINYKQYYNDSSIEKYKRILNGSLDTLSQAEISSSGYVVDTLEASIWLILHTNSYEELVKKAVSLGDDTDTISAISGSIGGLIYGYNNIPKEWLDKIKKKDQINQLCLNFTECLNKKNINKEDNYNESSCTRR